MTEQGPEGRGATESVEFFRENKLPLLKGRLWIDLCRRALWWKTKAQVEDPVKPEAEEVEDPSTDPFEIGDPVADLDEGRRGDWQTVETKEENPRKFHATIFEDDGADVIKIFYENDEGKFFVIADYLCGSGYSGSHTQNGYKFSANHQKNQVDNFQVVAPFRHVVNGGVEGGVYKQKGGKYKVEFQLPNGKRISQSKLTGNENPNAEKIQHGYRIVYNFTGEHFGFVAQNLRKPLCKSEQVQLPDMDQKIIKWAQAELIAEMDPSGKEIIGYKVQIFGSEDSQYPEATSRRFDELPITVDLHVLGYKFHIETDDIGSAMEEVSHVDLYLNIIQQEEATPLYLESKPVEGVVAKLQESFVNVSPDEEYLFQKEVVIDGPKGVGSPEIPLDENECIKKHLILADRYSVYLHVFNGDIKTCQVHDMQQPFDTAIATQMKMEELELGEGWVDVSREAEIPTITANLVEYCRGINWDEPFSRRIEIGLANGGTDIATPDMSGNFSRYNDYDDRYSFRVEGNMTDGISRFEVKDNRAVQVVKHADMGLTLRLTPETGDFPGSYKYVLKVIEGEGTTSINWLDTYLPVEHGSENNLHVTFGEGKNQKWIYFDVSMGQLKNIRICDEELREDDRLEEMVRYVSRLHRGI